MIANQILKLSDMAFVLKITCHNRYKLRSIWVYPSNIKESFTVMQRYYSEMRL